MRKYLASSFEHRLMWPFILFAVTAVMMGLVIGVIVPHGHLMYVFPVAGVQLALVLHVRRTTGRYWIELAAVGAGFLVASIVLHAPVWVKLALSLVQSAELVMLVLMLEGQVNCFDDLKTRVHVLRFFFAAILAPMLAAAVLPLAPVMHLSHLQVWAGVALADSLGIAVFTPALLFLLSGRLFKKDQSFHRFKTGSAASLFFLTIMMLIFSQTVNPFLFLAFPPLIVVVFVLGVRGAIFTSLASTLIACAATATGHGPAWIAHGVTMEHRILVLQIFLWSVIASGLPVGSLLDEKSASEQEARKNQTIYQTMLQNSQDMIVLARLDGLSRFVSPAVERLTGWTPLEYLALPSLGSVHEEDRDLAGSVITSLGQGKTDHSIRYRLLHKDGNFRWVEAFVRGYSDEEGGPNMGYVGTVRDISSLKETEDSWTAEKHALASEVEQLADLAGRDELTGLANRRTFNHTLAIEVARQSRSPGSLSLLMIDVDSFKKFNDRYGHPAGDVCLQKVARVFEECACRAGDLQARVGGEEFALLLPQTDAAGSLNIANLVIEGIRNLSIPHEDSPTGYIAVSIGVSTWLPYQSGAGARLIQEADRALYESKRAGRNRMSVWNGSRESLVALEIGSR